ncbi:hypothetical protein [Algoriphagus boritolerans]|uniref:Uncharacterized protein n=1 Tax=Algoriphagus boritolerans DSM 17298 = JCM 18970 TaxID=1120964 RepID=A0A1H5UFD0_9BACT|nr:hypothetical protein [Algoriphagus boritolerans]SEF73744.1 hypothetical protein SAMN03080598_01235 [Algoriphagus boritolerans DSM 17298 = JCM 18970]
MLKTWYIELNRRNYFLAKSGTFCFLLAALLAFFPFVDPRELQGVSVWLKPLKFFISVGIFFWTMGWLMDYLGEPKKVKIMSLLIFWLMVIELVLITFQAAQGKLSHFNISSFWDIIIFQIMGIAILLNSLVVVWFFICFKKVSHLPKGYALAIQIGLIIFLIAGFEGFVMAGRLGHTVGAVDGQEGIFLLGWAKAYGDLRIFHFLGLHALQVLPLLAWFFWKESLKISGIVGLLYFLLSSATLWMAIQGNGFWQV